jgi:DNA repair exonuclease SbcCD ATPase subunit
VILHSLEVENFRAVREARLTFARGLNVLYGPNDLGKSSLVEALRAAFLLSPQSAASADFRPWGTDQAPKVVVKFEFAGVVWRITKEFAIAPRGTALLERKSDGDDWQEVATGRAVEGKLREIIAWGIPGPGGRGAPRGLPESYLSTAFLGRQDAVTRILEASPEADGTDSGLRLITQALDAIGQDPVVGALLQRLQDEVKLAFTETGRIRQTGPLAEIVELRDRKLVLLRQIQESVRKSQAIETEIQRLREKEFAHKRRVELLEQVKSATETVEKLRQHEDSLAQAWRELEQAERELAESEAKFKNSSDAMKQTDCDMQQACEKRDRLAGSLAARKQNIQQERDNRRHELILKREAAQRNQQKATEVRQAELRVAECERKVQQLEDESKRAKQYESHVGAFAALAELITVQQEARALHEATVQATAAEASVRKAEATLADAESVLKTRMTEAAAAATHIAEFEHRLETLRIQEKEIHVRSGCVNAAVEAGGRLEAATAELRQFEEEQLSLEARLDANTEEREACDGRRNSPVPWPFVPALLAGTAGAGLAAILGLAAGAGLAAVLGFAFWLSLPFVAVAALGLFTIVATAVAVFLRQRKQQQAVDAIERELAALERTRAQLLEKRNHLAARHAGAQSRVEAAQREYERAVAQADVPEFNRDNANTVLQSLQSELEQTKNELTQVQDELTRARATETVNLEKPKRDIETAQAVVDQHRRERDRKNNARIAAQERLKIALRTLNDEHSTQLYLGLHGSDDGSPTETTTHTNVSAELERLAIENEAKLLAALGAEMKRSQAALQQTLDSTELEQAPAGIDRQPEEYRFLSRFYQQIEIALQHAVRARVSPNPEITQQIETLRQQLREARNQGGRELATVSARHLLQALQCLKTLFTQRRVELDTRLASAREQISSAKSLAERAAISLNASADDILRDTKRTLEDLDQKLANFGAECDAELAEAVKEADAARAEADVLQDKYRVAVEARDAAAEERDQVRQRRIVAEKRVEDLGNLSVTTSVLGAQIALDRCRNDFAAESGGTSLPDASTAIGIRLEREQAELRSVEDKLKEKRGELNHVGGCVFRERLDREQEAYDCLVKRAVDLESEYSAKQHLFNTLKREEEKQSTHLGRILAGPVSAIFAGLTAGRYSQLVLNSGLRFKGVVVAMKGERPVETLSVGTRDQLATLVRLSLAAHLRSAIVLDDQLTQSDARAMRWFRDHIRASVRNHGHQVVVVTCHPEDYLDPEEMPASGNRWETPDELVAAADLTHLVSRGDTMPAS